MMALRRLRTGFVVIGFVVLTAFRTAPVATAAELELKLVLALDASSSVARGEFDLQVQGLAQAFRHPQVQNAIASLGGLGMAVTVMQWSSPARQRVAIPWMRLNVPDDAATFAGRLAGMPRFVGSGGTATGQAIAFAQALMNSSSFSAQRRVIDISGDGRANMGKRPARVRDKAVAEGLTINGLAILNEEPHVDRYYARDVIGGNGAFLMTADSYPSFQEAIRRKLVREISGSGMVQSPEPNWNPEVLPTGGVLAKEMQGN